ncbi:MAG: phosphate transport system protein [Cellvibrionaceae bacterium]|jgi:phosphate transport system protein
MSGIITRGALDAELKKLNENITRLTSMVHDALSAAMDGLEKQDYQKARNVVDGDHAINQLRYVIEQDCLRVLAIQQPQASDLRRVVVITHLATELERIGDHASGISRLQLRMVEEGVAQIDSLHQLPKMGRRVEKMIKESMQAYLTEDIALANKVINRDDKVDRQYGRFSSIMFEAMNSADVEAEVRVPTYLLWMAHNLERMGDRVTNICERIIFMISGEWTEAD